MTYKGSCDVMAKENAELKAELQKLRNALEIRERQLSLILAEFGRSKNLSVAVIYNERGEFLDAVDTAQTAADPYCPPKKLAKLEWTK